MMHRRSQTVKGLSRAVAAGTRVFLRPPAPTDRREYLALRKANRRFLQQWEPRSLGSAKSFTSAEFDRLLRTSRSPGYRKMLICLRDSGQIIGSVNFNGLAPHPFLSTTMGYWIAKTHAGQGYMRESIGLMLGFAFKTLGLHRVEANIMPNNKASLALIRKCGFRFEGLAKRYLQINGKWSDHERWGMTVEDWKALQKSRPTL